MIKIAVLKPRATFGHGVAKRLTRKHALESEILFCESNLAVCNSVAEGQTEIAVVPLENNIAGLVPDWLTWCVSESKRADGIRAELIHEVVIDVGQCLMVKPGLKKSEIKKVLSHERALKQCSHALQSIDALLDETKSTAAAAEIVSKSSLKEGLAAIAAETAAEEYGLEIIGRNIEDQQGNVTRFGILRFNQMDGLERIVPLSRPTKRKKVVIKFDLPNEVGSLHKVTTLLLQHGANMTSLRDLPRGLAKQYIYSFYVEYEVPVDMAQACLGRLKQVTENLSVFGDFYVEDKE